MTTRANTQAVTRWHVRLWEQRAAFTLAAATWREAWQAARQIAADRQMTLMAVTEVAA